jgi:hypothetical protein
VQVESKYGHSSTGDPAFPKALWPTAKDCPNCRVAGKAAADSAEQLAAWNEDEVYQLLLRHYGGQARQLQGTTAAGGTATRQSGGEGGSAIMQAALEAEAEASGSGLSRWMTAPTAVCVLLVFGLVVWVLMQRTGRSHGLRRPSSMKGPGAHIKAGPMHHLPRYGRVNGRSGY